MKKTKGRSFRCPNCDAELRVVAVKRPAPKLDLTIWVQGGVEHFDHFPGKPCNERCAPIGMEPRS